MTQPDDVTVDPPVDCTGLTLCFIVLRAEAVVICCLVTGMCKCIASFMVYFFLSFCLQTCLVLISALITAHVAVSKVISYKVMQ